MIDMLRGSLLWRVFYGLYVALCNSCLARFSAKWKAGWRSSVAVALLGRIFTSQPTATQNSGTARRLSAINRRLHRMGQTFVPMLQNSLLYRIYGCIFTAGRNSRVFGKLFDGGLTTFFLLTVGLYAAIDFLLRDVLAVPVVSSTWDEALLLLAVVWIVYDRIRTITPLENKMTPMDMPMFLFVMAGFGLMFLVSPFFSIAVSGYRATVQYMLWFFLGTRLVRNEKDFMTLYLTLVGLAFLISLHGIYQYIVAAPIPENWTDQAEQSVRTRVYSIFGSPNIMGNYMVMFAPMAAGLAYYVKGWKAKAAFWFVTLCMCLSCLFTMSRGAWAAMALAIVIFALLVDRRLFLLMLAAGIVACFLPFVASRLGYLFTEEYAASTANGGRNSRWELALEYLHMMSPVWGVGLGMFGGAIAMQHKIYAWVSYFYVDNYYLKIMVEMGYFGFAVFLFMMVSAITTGLRSVARTAKTKYYSLCAGMLSGLSGVLLHCYTENIFEEPYMMVYFWSIVALLVFAGFTIHKTTTDRKDVSQ
ncbi:MAG: O-antigen ligase family protein [Eubacteriales bacterium]